MKGILFKFDMINMIKAIVDGRKTQIRRVMQNQPYEMDKVYEKDFCKDFGARKPRYRTDEVVYIKEAWCESYFGLPICYKADGVESPGPKGFWRSPLFMPAKYARYFLRITNVRVERLNQITETDCIDEGIIEDIGANDLRGMFAVLWDSINKPPYAWGDNPWVWVYTFEKL